MDAQQQALLDQLKQLHLDYRAKTKAVLQKLGLYVDTQVPLADGPPAVVCNDLAVYCGAETPDADKLVSELVTADELQDMRTNGDVWRCICEDAKLSLDLPDIKAELGNETHKCVLRGIDISDMLDGWRASGSKQGGIALNLSIKIPMPEVSEISCIMDNVEYAEVVAGFMAFSPSVDKTVHTNLITRKVPITVSRCAERTR